MNFRKKFDEIKKAKTKPSQELEEIVKDNKNEYSEYSSYSSGGLLSLGVVDTHKIDGVEAFILGKGYSIANAGVERSTDFGIIQGENVYRRGFKMVRGGTAKDIDDPHSEYNEIKIIEKNKDNAIIGLYSGSALDFFKIDFKNGSSERLKRYDLAQERINKEKKELELKAKQTEDFEEKLKTFGEKLAKEFSQSRYPEYKIINFKNKKLGVIEIETYDRNFDASTEDIHFYILEEGKNKPEKILTRTPSYDKSYKYNEKFFQVYAKKEISDKIIQKNGKIKIPVKLTIVGNWNCGYPGQQYSSDLKKESFELEYELKNLK